MPKKLTVAEKRYASEAASRWTRYERIFEEHSVVFRQNPQQYYEVYNTQYINNTTNHANFMPGTGADRDRLGTEAERLLQKDCKSILDRIHACSAALFLQRKITADARDQGEHVYHETLRCKTQMNRELQSLHAVDSPAATVVSPVVLHLDSQQTSCPSSHPAPELRRPQPIDTPMQLPATMPVASSFTWDQIDRQSAARVTSQQITQWKQNPEPLQQHIFIAKVDGEEEAFKLTGLLTMGKERVFYLQFVEDDEAIGYSSKHLFGMLVGAMQVRSG